MSRVTYIIVLKETNDPKFGKRDKFLIKYTGHIEHILSNLTVADIYKKN